MRTYQKLMMLAAALLTAGTVAVNAQDFYYDDIYGESPKAKKKPARLHRPKPRLHHPPEMWMNTTVADHTSLWPGHPQ